MLCPFIVLAATVILTATEHPALACKPLVVFYGGASDTKNKHTYNVYKGRKEKYKKKGIDSLYFSHSQGKESKEAIRRHQSSARKETPVILIGHSWGGDTAYDVAKDLPDSYKTTLVTLDPVGGQAWDTWGIPWFFAYLVRNQLSKPLNGIWINVAQPAPDRDFEIMRVLPLSCDRIASMGGLWGYQGNATHSPKFEEGWDHCSVEKMFKAAEPLISPLLECR